MEMVFDLPRRKPKPVERRDAVIIFIVLLFASHATVAYDGTLVSRICNGDIIPFTDNEYNFPEAVVDMEVEAASKNPRYPLSNKIFAGDTFGSHYVPFYASGYCSRSLSDQDCAGCLQSAMTRLFDVCSRHGRGAQIHLKDCYIRYEMYHFL
ncbi:hypothetical protein MLD38_028875 [Melastoma candidum]|uniref:Uncharacterized protein n=1 Tax=Melastoma candidum TaxID=119954 RepID=A0ACB9N363_9MYRT|nr:hypothetical protein MLD38_028875 [Melastoma candidum]